MASTEENLSSWGNDVDINGPSLGTTLHQRGEGQATPHVRFKTQLCP